MSRLILRRGLARFVPCLFIAVVGCDGSGDGLPREPVAGTVTLDAQPLARGLIQFLPESGDAKAASAAGEVEDGKFSIPRSSGPTPGKYKVAITSPSEDAPPKEIGGPAPPPAKDLIPARYNAEGTLTAEIKAGGDNTFAFELKK